MLVELARRDRASALNTRLATNTSRRAISASQQPSHDNGGPKDLIFLGIPNRATCVMHKLCKEYRRHCVHALCAHMYMPMRVCVCVHVHKR